MPKLILKITILLVLLLGGPFAFAQDEDGVEGESHVDTEQIENQNVNKSQIEALQKQLNVSDPKLMEKLQNGELGPDELKDVLQKAMDKMPKDQRDKIEKVLEKKVTGSLDYLRGLPYDEAFNHIKKNMQISKAAPLFAKLPKSYTLVTNLLRDKEAPEQFMGIIKDKKKLYLFGGCSLFLIVVGWIIKKKRRAKKLPIGEAFAKGLTHFLLFSALKLGLVVYFFGENLAPALQVVLDTY